MRSFLFVILLGAVGALAACSQSSSGATRPAGADAGASSGPCDPLATPATALQSVVGAGQDAAGTVYVVDRVTQADTPRVFVKNGAQLDRKNVIGTGQSGSSDYTLSFIDPGADTATAKNLVLAISNGKATSMALGADPRAGVGDPANTPLTLVDASSVSALPIVNLPNMIWYVADVANGNVIVVTSVAQNDVQGYGSERLFYGVAGAMFERHISNVSAPVSGGQSISFDVAGGTFVVNFTFETTLTSDGGFTGAPGPATLDDGSGTPTSVTQRVPTPTTLDGLVFTCNPSGA